MSDRRLTAGASGPLFQYAITRSRGGSVALHPSARHVSVLVEAAVESLDDALAAVSGGADRLELCADLDAGGTTPARALVADVLARVSVPVLVMIRPRPGDFVYTRAELDRMRDDIAIALDLGATGVVVGALDASGRVAVASTRELLAVSRGRPVTFHRAIDETPDPLAAVDTLASLGVARVLSSGAAPTALEGADTLAAMVARAGDALRVVAGGGVRAHSVAAIVRRAHVREVHARCEADAARIRSIRQAATTAV